MRKIWALAAAVTMLAATAASAQTVINVSTWGGPNHGVNTIVWPTWKTWIEEATDNRVTVRVIHDLAPPQAQMDAVTDGVADASWIFHSHLSSRFKLTQLADFPVRGEYSSEVVSAAYWHTYNKHLAPANEHRGVEVMAVAVHGPGQIFMREKITSLDQLAGKRVRVGGGVMNEVLGALKGVGVAFPPPATYEAASTGVIDGAMLPVESLTTFKLDEVAPHIFALDGGFYRGSFAIVMNPRVWEKVSAEDRAAIENVSGESLARLFGYMMDQADQRALDVATSYTRASAADTARVHEFVDGLKARWIKEASASGVDGEAALTDLLRHIEQKNQEAGIAERVAPR